MNSPLERRHRVRRSLGGGLVLGTAAGLIVGAFEVVWVLRTLGDSFDGRYEAARFAACTVALLGAAGALAGLAQGLLAAAVTETAAALGDGRWRIRFYTALATLPVALVCGQIFRGAHARTIAHHDLYAVAIGVVALSLFHFALRLWHWLYRPGLATGLAFALALGCLFCAHALYRADQTLLVRLYPFFHAGLGVLTFAAVELALALGYLGLWRRAIFLVQPRFAVAIALCACSLGAGALGLVSRTRSLRAMVADTTLLAAPLLRLVPAPAPPATVASEEAVRAPLPDGPRLASGDVFIITIDALRADRLSPRTMPRLWAWATHGVVFEHAYTQVPHTSFSIATLLTGKYVFALSTLGLDAARSETLAEIMKRERYKTAAFFPPAVFTIDRERLKAMEDSRYGFEYTKYEFLDAAHRTDQVIQFLAQERPPQAFVWIHYFEPHEPYVMHPGHLDKQQGTAVDAYDSEVHFVDAELGRLIDYLQRTRPHALVVVAADHGEEFGEHGGRYHGTSLFEEQVRVPLVFLALDGGLTPHHVAEPVGLVDVAPTILSLTGILPSARMRGRDLGPWLLPPPRVPPAGAHGPVYAEIGQQKMILAGTHKLSCDLSSDTCRAFDLAVDPAERKSRLDEPWVPALRQKLDHWMLEEARFEAPDQPGDPAVRKLLERARLGDAATARLLPPLLADPSRRREVARLLATLPPAPANRRALLTAGGDTRSEEWLTIARARLGDNGSVSKLARMLPRLCEKGGEAELCARGALATGAVPAMGEALFRGGLDESLQLQLVAALGRSQDPRAVDPLLIQLGRVRTRVQTLDALAQLDDARVLPTLLRWVPHEPYVPVRARMVSLVAQLGRHAPATPRRVLHAMAQSEREAPVMAALLRGLRALGDRDVVDIRRARARAGGELWLVGQGSGALELTVGGAPTQVKLHDGVGHLATPAGGEVALRQAPSEITVRLAFCRRGS